MARGDTIDRLHQNEVMGYYIRFVSVDARPIVAAHLQAALFATSGEYKMDIDQNVANIHYAGATIAQIEINIPGDGLFEEERDELIELASNAAGDRSAKARVIATVTGATAIIVTRVLPGASALEATLSRLEPLWAWLFRNRAGLLYRDGKGYYDRNALLLHME
jgi:hypothetical protein